MFNTTEQELRLEALDRALHFHQGRQAEPTQVLATAKIFATFLKGEPKE